MKDFTDQKREVELYLEGDRTLLKILCESEVVRLFLLEIFQTEIWSRVGEGYTKDMSLNLING